MHQHHFMKISIEMDFIDFQESQIVPWISKAESFIKHIVGIIGKGADEKGNDIS